MSHVHGVVRREGMGFKAMPWELYYKPSLGEFVIRQRHTTRKSERVKAINAVVAKSKPAIRAHERALQSASGHLVYIYKNGQAIAHVAADIKAFKAALRDEMNNAINSSGLTILKRNPVQEAVPRA